MRKLSILFAFAALSLVTTTSFAQEVKEEIQKVTQEKVEVQLSELPEAVTKALGEEFADYDAKKAYKTQKENKEVYYVKLEKDGKYIKVLIDSKGNVIENKEIEIKAQSKLG